MAARKMVETDRYCADVLRQSRTLRQALGDLERLILMEHLQFCVIGRMRGTDAEAIRPMVGLFARESGKSMPKRTARVAQMEVE